MIAGDAARDAASTQAEAADKAAIRSMKMYDMTRNDLAVYRDKGDMATRRLGSFLDRSDPYNEVYQLMLENQPGYQFALREGLKSTQNAAAARGQGMSGAAMRGAAQFATGLANQTAQQNLLQPLQFLAGLGANASAATGKFGEGATNAANAALIGGANAQAAGINAQARSEGNAITSLFQLPMNLLGANNMMGNPLGSFFSGGQPSGGGVYPAGTNANGWTI
jgi:hypothetical protein